MIMLCIATVIATNKMSHDCDSCVAHLAIRTRQEIIDDNINIRQAFWLSTCLDYSTTTWFYKSDV